MAESGEVLDGAVVEDRGSVEPSVWHALPYFMPVVVFLLVANAAIHGGWWMAAPLVFFLFAEVLDKIFGTEERNMDPAKTTDGELLWYKLALWTSVTLWPVTLAFALWQILVVGHLATWEALLMAVVLGNVATIVLVAGHEAVHETTIWQRRFGEFLLGSIGCAHYAAEHVYVHHARVATPSDPMTARKGQSFWQYLPWAVAGSILESLRNMRERLALRHLPVWHYTNPFWRYGLLNFAWFALAYWMGGAWGLLIFSIQCSFAVFLLRLGDYVEHYGLTRLYLPSGRFERFQPWHSWNAVSKFSNWLYYNTQRHSDHHGKATRVYPLLQNHEEDQAPRMPGGYARVFNLALSPKRWFETMDPLVERWRARYYPEVGNWRVYDSPAFAARPDAFKVIAEIHALAPRLADWIDRYPELLDCLQRREFTDLDLPDGFGPNPEFERIARNGLARLYWTHEFSVSEMQERITDIPVQGVREAVEVIRSWSNDKVFQIGMHTIRGSLSPVEAGTALSNVAEASIVAVLSTVERHLGGRHSEGGIAAALLGDLASRDAAPGVALDILFVHDGEPRKRCEALCRRFLDALRALSSDNLLLAPLMRGGERQAVCSLADFVEHRSTDPPSERLRLTRARCVFTSDDSGIAARFEQVRREILADPRVRDALVARLREPSAGTITPSLLSIDDMPGGLWDVECAARLLQVTPGACNEASQAPNAVSVFQAASERGLIPDDAGRRLVEAAGMWRNLKGILGLIGEDGFAARTAPATTKTVVARSSGAEDFDALTILIRETASRTAAEIDALDF